MLFFLKNIYKNKKVLVTGSTGFKGSWLCFVLIFLGAKVVGIAKYPEKGSIIFKTLNLKKSIKQYYFDIINLKKLDKTVKKEKPDIIFHLAAQSVVSTSYKFPIENYATNVMGSLNVLECVKNNKINNLVYVTSDKCYQNFEKNTGYKENEYLGGHDNYSASKACAEIVFHAYCKSFFKKKKNLQYATARAGNVIGGGDFKINRVVPDIIKSIISNKAIKLRSPNSVRPWQHVLEPISGYLILGSHLIKGRLHTKLYPSWNFGPYMKNSKTVLQIAKLIIEKWSSKKFKIIYKNKSNFFESKLLKLNISKAKKEIGWSPTLDLNSTINLTVDWYKSLIKKENMNIITKKQIEFFFNKNLKK